MKFCHVTSILSVIVLLPGTTLSLSTTHVSALSVEKIVEYEVGAHLENLAVRPTGDFLVSRVDKPYLYLVDPFSKHSSLVVNFENATSTLGIVEYRPDIFAVCVGSANLKTSEGIKGSWSLMTVDLRGSPRGVYTGHPTVLVPLPEAVLLNGLTLRAPRTLYTTDSGAGVIWSVDLITHEVQVIANSSLLAPSASQLGANGLRWSAKDSALYFTNSALGIIGRVPLLRGGRFGPPQEYATIGENVKTSSYDDIVLDREGDIYATTGNGNTINFIEHTTGRQNVLVGSKNSTLVPGPTAARFGRTPKDKDVLYVSAMGSAFEPIDGQKVPGQVLAIKLGCRT